MAGFDLERVLFGGAQVLGAERTCGTQGVVSFLTSITFPASEMMMAAIGKKQNVVRRKEAWSLEQRPGFLIRRLQQINVASFHRKCASFNLTPLQYSLLTALARCKVADQTTLAAAIALDRTTTTGALKRLHSRKLIERAVQSRDRRAQMCQLTKSGAKLLLQIEASAHAAQQETLRGLNQTEQKRFVAMLQKVVAAGAERS